uniref:hypothetical protein n=1 Tax=Fuscoporia viticola TaxID=139386 RepID=UPI0023AB1742|nr:hypothetical protein P1Q19_mgp22 [Fuscoporia viticola]WCF76837.1 hypothetical protein [Fuscoporia viticola]
MISSNKSLKFNLIKSIDRNIYLIFVVFILLFMLFLSIMWFTSENNVLLLQMVPDGKPNNNVPMDPVRWWPSGVPQSMAVVGTMVGTFIALTKLGINPRFRFLGALGAGGVSTTQVIYNSAIENSVGFNRFMYSITEYKKTGQWPNIDQMNSYSEEAVNNNITKALEQADQAKIKSMVEEITKLMNEKGGGGSSSSNFVSNSNNGNSNLVSNFMDSILDRFSSFFTPSPVSGYLDDLIGQQIVLQFVILLASVSLLLLVIAYIINNLLLLNKDFITKHLGKNKLIVFYLKYQVISIKISLFVLPLFIFLGLITLIQSSYYMITHPIPYEILDVNLHVYVDSK